MSKSSGEILQSLQCLFPKDTSLDLERMKRLLQSLENPQINLPETIHITGSNGKGSTLAMIRAGLEASGKSIHRYASPHLKSFHERILINGQPIKEELLVDMLEVCEQANNGQPITLFEISTCAAFLAFSKNDADYLLLEVGIGGRLDATNVVENPAFCIITPVSMDHQGTLGDSLELIAFEKAGILKPKCPCIVAKQETEVLEVIEKEAEEKESPLFIQDRDWRIRKEKDALVFEDNEGSLNLPLPKLIGVHQVGNAGTSVALLRKLGLNQENLEKALLETDWPARMQRLSYGPLVEPSKDLEIWLDGGHNPAAGRMLSSTIQEMEGRHTSIICGLSDTKDARGFLKELKPASTRLYGVKIPEKVPSMSAEKVSDIAKEMGYDAKPAESVKKAVEEISEENSSSRVLICGSLYLAGNVLRENG